MTSWIADRIAQMLITSSLIEEGDWELYSYGFFMIIGRIYYFFVTVVTGLLMGIPFESALFYVVFMVLRTYAGGVHAKTEIACSVLTTLAMISSVLGIKQLELLDNSLFPLLMLGTGSLCILLFSPMDTNEKPLDEQEQGKYKAICVVIVLMCIIVALISQLFSIHRIFYAIVCSIFLESILLIVGKINCLSI